MLLTALLCSLKSILSCPMALMMAIRLWIVLLYTTGWYWRHYSEL